MASTWNPKSLAAVLLVGAACVASSQTVPARDNTHGASLQTTSARGGPARPAAAANATSAPVAESSIRFAVLGDTGTGERPQYDIGAQLWKSHEVFPFEFVIM